MKIFDILRGRKKVRDAYMGGDKSFVSRWARPPSKNTAEWLDMYSKSPRLSVVEKIASDLASLEGHLLRINPDGTETELIKHPFLDFMAHPNPLYEMTSSALWRLNEIYLMLVGESFFLIERDENERPIELWSVPPHWVKMTPYLGNPGYMITSPSGLTMTVPVEDMFVMKRLNPLDPFMRGLGVAESIADEIEIDEFSAQFQKRFFYNDGTPSLVFLMPDASEEQRDAFMARWNKRHRGVENSHKAAALTGNVSVQTFGSKDVRELGFVESRIAIRDAVLEHFGVPREIMGITENSNRSTADSAQYIYAKNVLTPRIRDRADAINQQLLPLFGDNLVWRFDPVVPFDKEFNKARALDGWNAGLLTKNEARELLDFPDVRGGDVYKVNINDLFMEQTADLAEVSQSLGKSYGEKKADRRVNIEAMLRKEDAAMRENERRFEAAITKHFAEQRSAVAKALGMTTKADSDALAALDDLLLPDGTFDPVMWEALEEAERQRLAEAVAAGLLNWREEAKKLTALFTPLWKMAYDDGAKISAESYSLIDLVRPEFVSQARVNGGKRIVGIQETTQKNIASIIARGVENGSSQNALKKEVLEAMGPGTTRARAKLIAQQETSMSLATGQFDTMKAAGATTKTWHHRDPQKDPRDGKHGKVNHVILEGETVDIDKPFSNGLMYPRDPDDGRPEEVIRCRCYLTYGGWSAPTSNQKPQLTTDGNVSISSDGTVSQQKWVDSLTEDEKEALHINTGPDNQGIQMMLRGEIPGNDELKKLAANIESALDKAVLDSDLQVKRGSDIFGFKGLLGLPEELTYRDIAAAVESDPAQFIDKIVSDDAFLSTSLMSGRSFEGVTRYYAKLGEGTHAAYVTDFADGIGSEKEILVQRKTKFKITDVSMGVDEDMGYDIIQVFMETLSEK